MPIYDFTGSASVEIGKIYDYNGSVNSEIGKVYDFNGSVNSLLFSSEVVLPQLTVDTFYNYADYNSAAHKDSGGSWNLQGCSAVTLSYRTTTILCWSNQYGVGVRTNLYLNCGGTLVAIDSRYIERCPAGATDVISGTKTISLAGLSAAQLSNVKFRVVMDNMRFVNGGSNGRYDCSGTLTNAVGS